MRGAKKVKITNANDPMNGSYHDSDAKAPPSANTHTPKAAVDTVSCATFPIFRMRHWYSGVLTSPIPRMNQSHVLRFGASATPDRVMPCRVKYNATLSAGMYLVSLSKLLDLGKSRIWLKSW